MSTTTNADDIDIEQSIETLHAALREIADAVGVERSEFPGEEEKLAKFAAVLSGDPEPARKAQADRPDDEFARKFVETVDLVDAIHTETTGKTASVRTSEESEAFKSALGGGR